MGLLNNIWKSLVVILLLSIATTTVAQENLLSAFKDSYALEQKGDFVNAAEKLNKFYQADSYEINLRLGWLSYLAGKLSEAESFYGKAITLKPYAIEPKLGLAFPLAAQAKWDELMTLYAKILEIDPQNTLVNYRMGLINYNKQNYEKADVYLEKVINLYPFDYDTLILLAWNKLSLGKTKEARVLFNKTLLYSPNDASALEGLKLLK